MRRVDTLCRHCRRRIIYEDSPVGAYWYHSETQSVWCGTGGDTRAEP